MFQHLAAQADLTPSSNHLTYHILSTLSVAFLASALPCRSSIVIPPRAMLPRYHMMRGHSEIKEFGPYAILWPARYTALQDDVVNGIFESWTHRLGE